MSKRNLRSSGPASEAKKACVNNDSDIEIIEIMDTPTKAGPSTSSQQPMEVNDDSDVEFIEESEEMVSVGSSKNLGKLETSFEIKQVLEAIMEYLPKKHISAMIQDAQGKSKGGDSNSLALSPSLPTLPFEVLSQRLDSCPIGSNDGKELRKKMIEVGAIHLVLNRLSIFSHQNSNNSSAASDSKKTTKKSILKKAGQYGPKGTGYGSGSTSAAWNVDQVMGKLKSDEEHVAVLLHVLSSYVNPGDALPFTEPDLPPLFIELLKQSCLIPVLGQYLRNDSVLDVMQHIPLYRAIMQLLRALSISSQLIQLVLKQDDETKTSTLNLLETLKKCMDTYASRLKVIEDEGLAVLIPDIQETTALVQSATFSKVDNNNNQQQDAIMIDEPGPITVEQKYLEVMKKLQYGSFDMIVASGKGFKFTVSYHYEQEVRKVGSDRGNPARVKRLAQEAVTLSTSLPLSYSSSIFVRTDSDRLDIMKVLITGPSDTPYSNGCFEFDIYFPPEYPNNPMLVNLETTGRRTVRFNPNLYENGKVCLSILNTWSGKPEEKWNVKTSSFLQVLVSIQSLILVPDPYFNEPSFQSFMGTAHGDKATRDYNSNIYQACVKWAMLDQIKNPSPCFKDVIHKHFWLKRSEICQQIDNWIAEMNESGNTFYANSLIRTCKELREEFAKLPVPEGLENFDNPLVVNPLPVENPVPQPFPSFQLPPFPQLSGFTAALGMGTKK